MEEFAQYINVNIRVLGIPTNMEYNFKTLSMAVIIHEKPQQKFADLSCILSCGHQLLVHKKYKGHLVSNLF